MIERKFDIGDRIVCTATGVVGRCIKFYHPTSCEEQTMVVTDDGRRYHAPTRLWILAESDDSMGYVDEKVLCMLNPFGEYVIKFARNHGMSIEEAYEQPMVKARLHFFHETGM